MLPRAAFAICCLLLPLAAVADVMPAAAPRAAAPLLPVPDGAEQAKARDMVRTIFKDDFAKSTPAARQALARRLVSEAAATKDDVAARYVLFSDGADMAATVGDSETAVQAIAELGRLYKVDVIELQKAALLRAGAAVVTPEAAETLVRLCLEAADAAALADAFEIVQQLANVAESAANKTRKVALVASIQTRLADLRGLVAEFAEARQALDQLIRMPEDAAAHGIVGKFYALHKGQWEAGLPHLAAGADPDLRVLAAKELAAPTDGLDQTGLGDGWWEVAEKSTGLTRTHAGKHALLWYERAEKSLTGITLSRIQTRLRTGVQATQPAKPGPQVIALTPGTNVNLLALIDPAKDAAEGKWSLEGGALVVTPGKYSTLQLPYSLPDEYDLRVVFTRTQGEGPINVLLAAHKRAFGLALDVKGEARFERVANKIAKDNPTNAPIAISNGRKYTVTVQIRKDAIRALLDAKLITQWKTDYKDLARYRPWKLPDEKLCGLGANNSQVTFHSVELIEVSGAGKALRVP